MDYFGEELLEIESPDSYLLNENDTDAFDNTICDTHNSIIIDFVKSIKDKKQELEDLIKNLINSPDKVTVPVYFKQLAEIEKSVLEIKESIKMSTIYDENYNEVPLSKVFIITSQLEELDNKLIETNAINAKVLKTNNNQKQEKYIPNKNKYFFPKEEISNVVNQSFVAEKDTTERAKQTKDSASAENNFIEILTRLMSELCSIQDQVEKTNEQIKAKKPLDFSPTTTKHTFERIQHDFVQTLDEIISSKYVGLGFSLDMIDRAEISALIMEMQFMLNNISSKIEFLLGDECSDYKFSSTYEELEKICNSLKSICEKLNCNNVDEKELKNQFNFLDNKYQMLYADIISCNVFNKELDKYILLSSVPQIKSKIDNIKGLHDIITEKFNNTEGIVSGKVLDKLKLYDFQQCFIEILNKLENIQFDNYKNVKQEYIDYKKSIDITKHKNFTDKLDGIILIIDNNIKDKYMILSVIENYEKKLEENKQKVMNYDSYVKQTLYTIHGTVALDKADFDKYLNKQNPDLVKSVQSKIDNYNAEFNNVNNLINKILHPKKDKKSKYQNMISNMFN